MEKIDEFEKEYEGFQTKTKTVTSLEEFMSFLDVEIGEYEYATKDFKKELRENALWRLEAQIRNFFFFIFEQEDVELYDIDDEIVMKCISLTQIMAQMFQRIENAATEENYLELTKLVDFANEKYYAQRDYYDYARDRIEFSAKGIYMMNSKYQDIREPFLEFLEKKVSSFESSDQKETPTQYVKRREDSCQQ